MATDDQSDVVNLEYANNEVFAVGNGLSRLFPLRVGDRRVTPTVIEGVRITDWQGVDLMASSYARTNLLPYSFGFTSGRWLGLWGEERTSDAPDVPSPDGQFKTTSLRLGDCGFGPDGASAGVYFDAADFEFGETYITSVWLRGTVPMVANLNFATNNPANDAGRVNVTTTWKRYFVIGTVGTGFSSMATFSLSMLNNVGLDDDEKLYLAYAQSEVNTPNLGDAPSRFVETNGSPVTTVDYVVNDASVIFTTPIQLGGSASWSGIGYWIQFADNPVVAPFNLKVGMTWRLDQSPRLNRLIDLKSEWYAREFNSFWEGWYASVFRLKSANSFGVAVWAYILGVPLGAVGLSDTFRYWGYGPTRGNYRNDWDDPVDQPSSGNFPAVQNGSSITSPLEQIAALRLRYYALTSNCTIAAINSALLDVFGEVGAAYVIDHEDMRITYVFDFPVSLNFQEAMLQYGLLPKPGGVKIEIQAP